jgi:DNA-binding transcriptional regulator YiaG
MNPDDLIAWRKNHNLTQEGLASLLKVTKACISRWESGNRSIPAFLDITLECLKVKKAGKLKQVGRKRKKKGGKESGS